MNASEQYRAALTNAARQTKRAVADGELRDDTAGHVLARLLHAIDNLDTGAALDRSPGADLVRIVVDGNGPRDPKHPLVHALDSLEGLWRAAARESGRIQLLQRGTVREIQSARDATSRRRVLKLVADRGVLVPMVDGPDARSGISEVVGHDGARYLPVFSERRRLDEWAGPTPEDEMSSVAITTLRALGSIAGATGQSVMINPGADNLTLAPADLGAVTPEEPAPEAPRSHPISFGAPASPDPTIVDALRIAAQGVTGIRGVTLATIVQDHLPRLVAVVDAAEPSDIGAMAQSLGASLAPGQHVDMMDTSSALAREIRSSLPAIYSS